MSLKSDQTSSNSAVAESRTCDILVNLNESIVGWALCLKVAQFLLKALSDVHQVVSSVFVGRSIDALSRFLFCPKPKCVLCGAGGQR
jgi:hypothetical protein